MGPFDGGSGRPDNGRRLNREQAPPLKSPPQRPIAQTTISLDSLAIRWLDATRTDVKQPARQEIQRQADHWMPLLPGALPATSRCCYNNGCHLTCQNLIAFGPLIFASPILSPIPTERAEPATSIR